MVVVPLGAVLHVAECLIHEHDIDVGDVAKRSHATPSLKPTDEAVVTFLAVVAAAVLAYRGTLVEVWQQFVLLLLRFDIDERDDGTHIQGAVVKLLVDDFSCVGDEDVQGVLDVEGVDTVDDRAITPVLGQQPDTRGGETLDTVVGDTKFHAALFGW